MDSSGNPIYQIIMEPGWDAFYVWMSKSDQEAIMKKYSNNNSNQLRAT